MVNEVIKALVCSATPCNKDTNCEGCRYRRLEEFNPDSLLPYDVEIDGKLYYESCDCDRICLDAAKSLEYFEQLKWERDIAITQLMDLGLSLGEKIDEKLAKIVKTYKEDRINETN